MIRSSIVSPSRKENPNLTNSGKDSSLLNFVQFAVKKNIKFSQVRPDVRDDTRGVYATYPIRSLDTLIVVPRSSALLLTPSERSPLGTLSESVWQQLPWPYKLSIKLAQEAARSSASSMHEFINVLPPEAIDLPLLWSAEDVSALQYPYLQNKVLSEQNQMQDALKNCSHALLEARITTDVLLWALTMIKSRSFEGPHFQTTFQVKLAFFSALQSLLAAAYATHRIAPLSQLSIPASLIDPTWPLVLAEAVVLILPLVWGILDLKRAKSVAEYVVCPFIDFLNHSSQSQAECQYDWFKDSYCVVSDRPYQPGQQVYINYGSQSNDQLLLSYGFVEEGNLNDRYILTRLQQWLLVGPLAAAWGDHEALKKELLKHEEVLSEVVVHASGIIPPNVKSVLEAVLHVGKSFQGTITVDSILIDACERELATFLTTLLEDENSMTELTSEILAFEAQLRPQQSEVVDCQQSESMSSLTKSQEFDDGQELGKDSPQLDDSYLEDVGVGDMGEDVGVTVPGLGDQCQVSQVGVDAQMLLHSPPSHLMMSEEEKSLKLKHMYRMKTLHMFRIEKKRLLHKFILKHRSKTQFPEMVKN
ncbi:hypothetical protein CEUSTIGMA_g1734.t1 [Chlamydomonas eustigma]|uniref:SET domain-containing protein n=1 Tax=Chlamydomonas eustigma TaxID=1157962 RepID=A0A250WU16_9CHLO|nr:hypothetical protein CEUSTIGMA_g1734.t1 [Chlamydomonas eustigma]|eukprot:GAX74285.1 hypothetical protein CEUSTIGMA_g1734.t1 [Chlamydomonas eustigma]